MKQNTLNKFKDSLGVVGILTVITLLVAAVIFFPIFTIWSLNLLFATGIPVNFYTWLSTVWLQSVISGSFLKFNKKD